MNVETWKKGTKAYIDNTILVRKLSSTRVAPEDLPQAYYESLRDNFIKIREIAEQNRRILDEIIYPSLENDELLSDDMVQAMDEFVSQLVDGVDILSLDTIIVIGVVERLLKDAHEKEDVSYIIHQLDTASIIYYTAYNMINRTCDMEALGDEYYHRGIELGAEILAYLDKEKFAGLPNDECREIALINSRYQSCFYETKSFNPKKSTAGIEHANWAREISKDPFYHEHAPNYDWFYHNVRLCEYVCTMTQVGNIKGLTKEQCREAYSYALELDNLVHENVGSLITVSTARLLSARVKYYAEKITVNEYMDIMLSLYELRNKDSYSIDDIYINLIIPTEYIIEAKKIPELTAENYSIIGRFYRDIVRYISRIQNEETLGALLEYYGDFLNNFLEYPGGMTFYEMVMLSLAGMHLPTYVHSNMVGKISLCIARHMLRKNPAYFAGLWDIRDAQDAAAQSRKILDFIYHAGILHDAGKLFIIDTVFIYGRKLLDAEFAIIKSHPAAGSTLLLKYPSTRAYAPIAAAHHKCADNKGGYAADFDLDHLPEKALAKIIMVADGMDAATDKVGRSYGKGISLEQYIDEVWEWKGKRYDPEVAALLMEDETLRTDLAFILENERQVLYYKSYDLMFSNFREES